MVDPHGEGAVVAVDLQVMGEEDLQPVVAVSLVVGVLVHLVLGGGDLYELEGLFATSKFCDNQTRHVLPHRMYIRTRNQELTVQSVGQDHRILDMFFRFSLHNQNRKHVCTESSFHRLESAAYIFHSSVSQGPSLLFQ